VTKSPSTVTPLEKAFQPTKIQSYTARITANEFSNTARVYPRPIQNADRARARTNRAGAGAGTKFKRQFRTTIHNLEKTELKNAIREYQEWCNQNYDVLDVDLSDIPVEISIKLKRTSGKVAWINGTSEIKYIRYAFKAYQKWGWEKFAETIRHELIHVHTIQNYQKGGHGRLFKMLVDKMDTTRHCESFCEDEAKYILQCSECDKEIGRRHKRSKIVKQPWKYDSKCCGENV